MSGGASTGGPLSVAVTADPELPVPPRLYGGIERVVAMLIDGLVERGHDVTLFCHRDSQVPCRTVFYPGATSRAALDVVRNACAVSAHLLGRRYDVVHSFGRLAYIAPLLPSRIAKLMSYQRAITPRSVAWSERLGRGSLHFASCSRDLAQPYLGRANWHVVHNGVPRRAYRASESVGADAPLVFLGRLEEIKGAHVAIDVARRSGRSLVIAGNLPPGARHERYFRERIEPHVDGARVRWAGAVTDDQKNAILGGAAALLFPIGWNEPFGIVMAEALACGTPVLGFDRGAVPEVVEHGRNGFVCRSADEMVDAVRRIAEIDRAVCRRIMEERFSERSVVDSYENLYRKLVAEPWRRSA